MMRGPLHPTRIDIPIETRVKVIDILNVTLASFQDLYFQVKTAHWNIKGPDFMPFHQFFDDLAAPLIDTIDGLAERIMQLGGTTLGTLRLAGTISILPEFPYNMFDNQTYTEALADRYAMLCKNLREGAAQMGEMGETTTEDYYLGLAQAMDKHLWFLESFLQGS